MKNITKVLISYKINIHWNISPFKTRSFLSLCLTNFSWLKFTKSHTSQYSFNEYYNASLKNVQNLIKHSKMRMKDWKGCIAEMRARLRWFKWTSFQMHNLKQELQLFCVSVSHVHSRSNDNTISYEGLREDSIKVMLVKY